MMISCDLQRYHTLRAAGRGGSVSDGFVSNIRLTNRGLYLLRHNPFLQAVKTCVRRQAMRSSRPPRRRRNRWEWC